MNRLIWLLPLLIIIFIQSETHQSIRLYTIYTPSHKILLDKWFLPSVKDSFEIITEFQPQECLSGQYKQEGWKKTTLKKVSLIIRAIKENWGTIFIYSDVDIQFFNPIETIITDLIRNKDLIIQRDSPKGVLCTGFFVCRANKKTLQLWQDVYTYMNEHALVSDQGALNTCLVSKKNPYALEWDYLPDSFFGGGTRTGYRWIPGNKLPLPYNIVMHHANWTEGITNKIAQLAYVRNYVMAKGSMHNPRRIS